MADLSSTLRPEGAFNTHNILLMLFEVSAREKELPSVTSAPVVAIDTQLGLASSSLQHYMDNNPQHQIDKVKLALTASKDAAKRKGLIDTITELDGRLIQLNVHGAALSEQTQKLTHQFWDLVIKKSMNDKPLNRDELSPIYQSLEALQQNITPYKEQYDQTIEETEKAIRSAETVIGVLIPRERTDAAAPAASAAPAATVTPAATATQTSAQQELKK